MLTTGLRTIKNLPALVAARQSYKTHFDTYLQSGKPPACAEKALLLANWASGGEFPKAYSKRNAVPAGLHPLVGFKDEIFDYLSADDAVRGLESTGY